MLVEDDPVSAAFLREAATALPAEVDVAGSMAEALACASARHHDLYLFDANLPDGRGETLLRQLREIGLDAPALAHTAAREDALRDRLLAAIAHGDADRDWAVLAREQARTAGLE